LPRNVSNPQIVNQVHQVNQVNQVNQQVVTQRVHQSMPNQVIYQKIPQNQIMIQSLPQNQIIQQSNLQNRSIVQSNNQSQVLVQGIPQNQMIIQGNPQNIQRVVRPSNIVYAQPQGSIINPGQTLQINYVNQAIPSKIIHQ